MEKSELVTRIKVLVDEFFENEQQAKLSMVGLVLGYWRKFSSKELMDALVKVAESSDGSESTSAEATRRAVAKLCVWWVEHGGCDFVDNRALRGRMFKLLPSLVSEALVMILQTMIDHDRTRQNKLQDFRKELVFCTDRLMVQQASDALAQIATPTDLADAIAALDRELLSCMNASNLSSTIFSVHFNQLAFGVVSQILCAASKDHQLMIMRTMVEVAARLYDLCDYNGVYALVSGLQAHNIERIPSLSSMNLPASHRLTLHQLSMLCNPDNNYAILRAIQSEDLAVGSPVVPFFPTYLRDIIALTETNPDFVVVGREAFRMLQFKENIIAQMQNASEVSPEQASLAASLRTALLSLPVLSEEVRDLQSDIWKAVPARSASRGSKRSSSILGRSLLLDKGQRISDKIHLSASSSTEVSPRRAKPLFSFSDPKRKHSSDEGSSTGSPAIPRSSSGLGSEDAVPANRSRSGLKISAVQSPSVERTSELKGTRRSTLSRASSDVNASMLPGSATEVPKSISLDDLVSSPREDNNQQSDKKCILM